MARVQVGRNDGVRHSLALYWVPFRLLGQTLWPRATATTVQVFHGPELVASHP